jgi:methionyl-tRNA formyltransferase
MKLGAGIAIESIEKILVGDGKVESMPQVVSTECELPHAPKIFKETCQINWNQPAKRIYDFVRGLSPVPAAWTMLHEESGETGVMMKVYQTAKTGKPVGTALPGTIQKAQNCLLVATADEWIELKSIQLAGKKRMEVRDFLNGFHNIEFYSFAAV